jgi:hypothetical protein
MAGIDIPSVPEKTPPIPIPLPLPLPLPLPRETPPLPLQKKTYSALPERSSHYLPRTPVLLSDKRDGGPKGRKGVELTHVM